MTPPLVVLLSAAHAADDVRVVRKEGAALAAAGWRVRHLCPGSTDAPATIAGVAIQTFRRRPGRLARLRGLVPLALRAARARADVLHASEPDAWIAALLAAVVPGRRTRVVLDVHEHYPSRLDPRLPAALRPPARAALRLACRVLGWGADAIVVAKDGLDADFARPGRIVPVRNYAAALPVTPRVHGAGPPTLAHLGALTRSRGWPALLDALPRCPPGTRALLVGRVTDGSGPDLHARAAALGLTDRVELVPWLPQPEALARIAMADIGLVLFQRGEENHRLALPHKLFDCMLAGLPVIAPIFAEEVAAVVRDSGCGLLIETGDPAAIAAAVTALGDPERRAAMGAAGRHAALTRYAWANEAARLVALYRRLAPLHAGVAAADRKPPQAAASDSAGLRL